MLTTKNTSSRNLLFAYATWWLGYVVLQSLVLCYSLGLSISLSIKDSLLTNSLLALAAYAMINLIRFYQPRQILRVIDSIGIALISMYLMKWIAKYLIEDASYLNFLDQSFIIRSFFAWIMISLFSSTASLWFYLREQQEIENRKSASEKLAREAELSRL